MVIVTQCLWDPEGVQIPPARPMFRRGPLPANSWVADTNEAIVHSLYLLHGEETPQYERLYLVEEGVHRGYAVQRHQVQLELPDSPLSTELLVVALRPLLQRRETERMHHIYNCCT